MKILNLDTTKKSSLVAYFSQFLTFWLYGFCFQSATIAQEYPGCFMRDAQNRIINLNSVCSGQPPSEIPLLIPTRKSDPSEESHQSESGQFNSSQLDQRGLEFLLKEYYRPSATSSTNDSSEACAFILDPKDYVKIDNVFSKLSFISTERPTFLIYVPKMLSKPLLIQFGIWGETNFSSSAPKFPNTSFQILQSPGIFKFRLPPDISPLEIGKKYRWQFAFSCSLKNHFMFSNVIQRELPNSILKNQLETTTNLQERIALYAANSFWFDALAELTKLLQDNPKFNQEDWFKIVSRIGEIIGNDSSKNKTESSEKLNNILEILRTNPQKAITIIQKEKIGDYIHPIALLDKLDQENISLFSEVEIDYYYDEFDTQLRSLFKDYDENPLKNLEQDYRELKDRSDKYKQLSLLFDDVIYEQYQGEEEVRLLTSPDFAHSNFMEFWETNLTNKNLIDALIEFYQEAWVKAKGTDDWQNKWSLLNNLGVWYTEQGNYARAFDSLNQSLAIASLHSNTSIPPEYNSFDKISQSFYNLGLLSYLLGDYANAIEYQKKSFLRLRERNPGQDLSSLNIAGGASLYALGNSYRAIGNYPRAIDLYSKSFIYRQYKLRMQSSPQDSALNNLGLLYFDLGDFENAVKQYQQAVERSSLIKLLALYNLGLVYLAQKNNIRAIESFQKLLVFCHELEVLADSPGFPSYLNNRFSKDLDRQFLAPFERAALNNIGLAYFGMGDFNKAINYYQQSYLKAQEFNHVIGEAIALGNQGTALFKSGNLVEAEKKLLEAIKIWESLRQGLNDAQKVYFFENHLAPYRVLQQLYITQNRPQLALEIAERGRARAFLDLLAKRLFSQPEQLSAISFPNLQEIQQIAIAQKATLIEYSIVSSKELFIWVVSPKGEIAFRRTDINFLNSSLKTFVSNTRESIGVRNRGQSQIIAFAPGDLIKLNTDPANNEPWQVVDFDPKSNLLKLTQSSFPEGITIQRPATDVTNKLTSRRTNNRSLQQLYQLLIEPISDLLPTNQNERVIFIPQGELFLVPFPALQDAKGKYLIEKHTILTAPSIQVLDLTRKQREKLSSSTKDILIVGNPTMPKVPLAPGEPRQQLAALPEAEKEATRIAQLLQTQPLLHDQATKAAIVQRMPNAKVLHFATHALLDDFRGVGSAIAFAPSENDNGMLTADEILNLKLSGELVVLSACNTGQGRITGDGVIGLSRSFISAGIPSVIVSLWSVPDAPTALLMVEFYRNWQQSGDKAVALRQAMLTAMQQHPNPQDWAAFTLIGEAK